MKIGHTHEKPPALPTTTPAPVATGDAAKASSTAATAAPAAAVADASAKVEISSTASTLLSGSGAGEFDTEKVTRMSDAIAQGTFKVNPEAIADKLIANAQELLVKVKG